MARNVKKKGLTGHKNRGNSVKRINRINKNHEILKELKETTK